MAGQPKGQLRLSGLAVLRISPSATWRLPRAPHIRRQRLVGCRTTSATSAKRLPLVASANAVRR